MKKSFPSFHDLRSIHVACGGQYFGTEFVVFTDVDPDSPAYGASFDLKLPITLDLVRTARDAKRQEFAAASNREAVSA